MPCRVSLLLAVQSVVSIEDRRSQPLVPSLWNLWIHTRQHKTCRKRKQSACGCKFIDAVHDWRILRVYPDVFCVFLILHFWDWNIEHRFSERVGRWLVSNSRKSRGNYTNRVPFCVISPYSCATADELSQICLSYFFGLAMIDAVWYVFIAFVFMRAAPGLRLRSVDECSGQIRIKRNSTVSLRESWQCDAMLMMKAEIPCCWISWHWWRWRTAFDKMD